MRVRVNANLSGAVCAVKGQEITVNAEQGKSLIERGLAVEVLAPVSAQKSPPRSSLAKNNRAASSSGVAPGSVVVRPNQKKGRPVRLV